MIPVKQIARSKNKQTSKIQSLDVDTAEDEGFIEGDIDTGSVISIFSFGISTTDTSDKPSDYEAPKEEKIQEISMARNEMYSSAPRGLTPPVNGEAFTVKRSYAMRPSTVRKLNALKTEHPDVNVLFNTIVDMAISHYYNYIFKDKGVFKNQE